MCMMCNGASLDDVRFHIHSLIKRVGWAVVPVQGDRPSTSWAYTIGLTTRFDHPELAVVGCEPSDTFAMWVDYFGALGHPRPEPRAFELVLPGRRARLDRGRSNSGFRPRHQTRRKPKRRR